MEPISVLVLCQPSRWAPRVVPILFGAGCHPVVVVHSFGDGQRALKRQHLVGYELVLVQPTLAALHPEVLSEWRRRWPHLLILEGRFSADGTLLFRPPGALHPGRLLGLSALVALLRPAGAQPSAAG